jgi:hypothetical protein
MRAVRVTMPAPVPLAVRGAVLLAGVVLALVPEQRTLAGILVILAGTGLALVAPRGVGSTVATAAFVLVWLLAGGVHDVPSVARTVPAAAALYLLHAACAFSACLPLDAEVSPAVLTRWLRRSAVPLVAAAAVVALDELIPRRSGSAVAELLGLVGVLVLAVAAGCAILRRDSSSIE